MLISFYFYFLTNRNPVGDKVCWTFDIRYCGIQLYHFYSGMVYDKTKTYDATFYFAGGLIALSGILIIPIRYVQVKSEMMRKNIITAALHLHPNHETPKNYGIHDIHNNFNIHL